MAIASVDGEPQRLLLDHGQRELAGDFSVRWHRCGISGLPRLSLGRRFMSSMHNPAHPGEILREYLPEGLGVGDAAKRLGVTRQALSALINGRAGVSASMALRLEAALGTSAEFWLAMQTNYDL